MCIEHDGKQMTHQQFNALPDADKRALTEHSAAVQWRPAAQDADLAVSHTVVGRVTERCAW